MPRLLERVPALALSLAVIVAPLAWGGTRAPALVVLALLLALGLAARLVASQRLLPPRRAFSWLVLAGLALAGCQLVPLPDALVGRLAPRLLEETRASLAAPGEDPALAAAEARLLERAGGRRTTPAARPLSVDPDATRTGALRLALGLAAFLLGAAACAGPSERRLLCASLAGLAFGEAVFGLADHFAGGALLPAISRPWDYGLPAGTFVNPNHFAALLSLGLFAAGALLADGRGGSRAGGAGDGATGRARTIVLATASAIVLLAMVWSSSRAGLAAAGLAIVALAAFRVSRRGSLRGRSGAAALGAIALLLLAAALWLRPPRPLVEDLGTLDVSWPWRAAVWRIAAGEMFPQFAAAGSGIGTFPRLEPLYRPPWMGRPAVHAHSDWLEWLVEAGVPGALLALAFIATLALALRRLLREGSEARSTAWLAAGLFALGLHATVDFPLQLPGVLVPGAALAGVLVAPYGRGPTRDGRSRGPSDAGWFAAASAALLLALGLAGAWRALSLVTPPRSGVEPQRAEARRESAAVAARLAEGPPVDALPALSRRAAGAVRTLRRLAVKAPLRGEIRLSQYAALRAFEAVELADGRATDPAWDALARAYLHRAESLAPTSRARLRRVLWYWLAEGDRDEAFRVAHRLLALEPAQAAGTYRLLEDAGAGSLGDLMAATPNRPQSAVQLARHLAGRGDATAAQIVLERALARTPGDALLAVELAGVLAHRGRIEEALSVLDRLGIPDDPGLARRAKAIRARLLARTGSDEALERLAPPGAPRADAPAETESVTELRARARLLTDKGRLAEAMALLERALERRKPPLTPRERLALLVALARVHERAGDLRSALAVYRQAAAIDPDHPAVRRFFKRLRRTE